jgi:AcrR family transcriptional regulator
MSPMPSSPPPAVIPEPRWERRKDARPGELAAAALELFCERGYAATRLDDVAAKAGVSKGTLYLYFANKEELFRAVVQANVVPAIADAELQLAQFDGTSAELLAWMFKGWWERILSQPAGGIPKLMLAEARNFPEIADFYYEQVVKRGTLLFRAVVERGISRGEFRAVDIDHTVHVLMAPMLQLAISRFSVDFCGRENRDPEQYIRTFLDIALQGLQVRPRTTEKDNS